MGTSRDWQNVFYPNDRPSRLTKNSFGRRANDAGPIWLGERLSSAKNDAAYTAVVYSKEGDKPFIDMMHDFVSQHKMDWFFSEWV